MADLGFVVFNASWGHGPGRGAGAPTYDGLLAVQSQAACAVEFARAHAAEYGGDPATMIVFGHSAGADAAAMVAFARPEPTAGCLGGTTLGPIDALVTWEGNWLLSVNRPDWNGALAADPRIMDAVTPWTYLAEHKDQKVVMLVSEDPNASLGSSIQGSIVDREVGDPWAADSWLAVRDPSGDLRRQLEANGAFADGTIGFSDVAAAPVLRPQGAGEPRHARRHAGLLPRLPERRRLGRLPGRLPEGGGEGLTLRGDRRPRRAIGKTRLVKRPRRQPDAAPNSRSDLALTAAVGTLVLAACTGGATPGALVRARALVHAWGPALVLLDAPPRCRCAGSGQPERAGDCSCPCASPASAQAPAPTSTVPAVPVGRGEAHGQALLRPGHGRADIRRCQGLVVAAETVTDGLFLSAQQCWDEGAVWWEEAAAATSWEAGDGALPRTAGSRSS